jgi:hypothetical protein
MARKDELEQRAEREETRRRIVGAAEVMAAAVRCR